MPLTTSRSSAGAGNSIVVYVIVRKSQSCISDAPGPAVNAVLPPAARAPLLNRPKPETVDWTGAAFSLPKSYRRTCSMFPATKSFFLVHLHHLRHVVLREGRKDVARGGVPEPHCEVSASGRDAGTLWVDAYLPESAAMSFEGPNPVATDAVPQHR